MKRQARFPIALSLIITAILYAAACGYELPSKPTNTAHKNGQNVHNDNSSQASVATSVSTQNNDQEQLHMALTGNQAPMVSSVIDVPQATPALDAGLNSASNFGAGLLPDPISLSHLPYHCDPRYYAPNIIQNNAACRRFAPIPYIGFGLDHAPPIAPLGPIGYRLKRDVGRIARDDDDDDGHRGWKSYHRH